MQNNLKYILVAAALFFAACTPYDPNNGLQTETHPNGTIKSAIMLKDGARNGMARYYDEKGRLLSETEYANDMKNGKLINYNPETSKPVMIAFFVNDVQHGEVTQFYRDGMLFRKSIYNQGRVDGLVTTYWPDGKVKAENNFSNGRPATGLKEYDKTGQLIKQPRLVIKKSASRNNSVEISLQGNYDSVEFYTDTLEEGKYFNPKSKKLRTNAGVCVYDYSVLKNNQAKELNILAKVKTNYGNTLILSGKYPLNE